MIYYKKGDLLKNISKQCVKFNKSLFSESIICLDVETSSGYEKNGCIYEFDRTKDKKYWESFNKVNLLYEWTIGIDDFICYGRNLNELSEAIREIKEYENNVIVWAHNLSYEFMYLLNIVLCDKLFARQAHKVIYFESYNIQFRCSYFLTRLSLESWGESVGIKKLIGNIDYEKIYTPNSFLNKQMLDYCEHDIKIMVTGLRKYVKKYGAVCKIPLTQTGEVRQEIKKIYKRDMSYHNLMTKLLPRDADEYNFLLETFWGAWVHANALHADKLRINVFSKDEGSAYPTALVSEKYPMTRWQKIRPCYDEYVKYNVDGYAMLVDVTLIEPICLFFNTYISSHKCYEKIDCVYDNGRILKGKKVSLKCTHIDLNIIIKMYGITPDRIIFNQILLSHTQYLDSELVNFVLDLYSNKTKLKNIPEMEDIYLQSKQYINSVYGMMIMKLLQSDVYLINDKWKLEDLNDEKINEKLEELRKKSYKNYLCYSHGVYITAFARKNLAECLLAIDEDVIYFDTDSIKYINEHEDIFLKYNIEIKKKLLSALNYHGISHDKVKPVDSKGNEHWLGVWENDKGTPYIEFKTLGAKRYAYKDNEGINHITVSGVNKEKGVTAIKDINDFADGLVFDYDRSGKLIMTYLYDMPELVWNQGKYDEYKSSQKYGVHAMPTTYEMKLSKDYKEIIERVLRKLI